MTRVSTLIKQFDWLMFLAVILLVCVGLVMIYSSISTELILNIDKIKIQLLALIIGLILLFAMAFFDYRLFKNYAYALYGIQLVLLVLVLIFGIEVRGTRGWFSFAGFQFQPAELAKFVLLIVLAKYFSSQTGKPSRFQFVVVPGILTLIPVALIMLQPDFGSAAILVLLWIGMLLLFGIKKKYSIILAGGAAILGWISWYWILRGYHRERILTFLYPGKDPLGSGYNIIQSKTAIGSGGIFGKGLGYGTQSQLNFLPDQHTDFIFAILAEELGLIGAVVLLALLTFLLIRMIKVARMTRDTFGVMLAVGVIFIFLGQSFLNIGMNIGVIPVTGVPLPLVSYGGSSLLIGLMMIGLLESIYVRRKGVVFE